MDPNPYKAPDEARILTASASGPRPEDVEAAFTGTDKSGGACTLSFTAEGVHVALKGSQREFSLSRADASAEVQIGAFGPRKVRWLMKRPQKHALTFEVAALEYLHDWLGEEAAGFRRQVLRSSWGGQLALGLFYLVATLTVGDTGSQAYWSVAIGGLLVIAALLARFTMNPVSLLVSALAWVCFSASIVIGVLQGGSAWFLIFASIIIVGMPRLLFLYRFLSKRSAPAGA